MSPKSTHWIPTERSPWAVIQKDQGQWGGKGEWHFIGTTRNRAKARFISNDLNKAGLKTRVVRAWIPLR